MRIVVALASGNVTDSEMPFWFDTGKGVIVMATPMMMMRMGGMALDGPRTIDEVIELLAAKLGHDPQGLQFLQIMAQAIQQLMQQLEQSEGSHELTSFALSMLVEKLKESDGSFDVESFQKEVRKAYKQHRRDLEDAEEAAAEQAEEQRRQAFEERRRAAQERRDAARKPKEESKDAPEAASARLEEEDID